MSRVLVGLTGGLASGKSTVARWLEEAGCRVVDADALVAGLYAPGEPGSEAVRRLFGERFLDARGAVDRTALAERVFADPDARRALEAAIHPLARRRFAELAAGAEGIVVLEATLLVEAGYAPDFDLVVSVEADRERQLARAVARGMDPEGAQARLGAQGDGAARRAAAHRILSNDGSLAELRAQVEALLAEMRAMPASPGTGPVPLGA